MSVWARGGRTPEVVSVIAGTPRATNGACSYRLNGNARSTSCASAAGFSGSSRVCSRMLSAAVASSAVAAVRAVSPEKRRRGGPGPANPSRLTTAAIEDSPPMIWRSTPGSFARASAPMPPKAPPSVETNTSVCASEVEATLRASSSKAPVPDALSLAPGEIPRLSRWASTTMASGERPGTTAIRLTSSRSPRPAILTRNAWRCALSP